MQDDDNNGLPSQLLRFYAALEYASEEMLQAARSGDWDAVCRLEGACSVVIARLREVSATETFHPGEQPERLRILRSILANDAEIRRIGQPLPTFLETPGALAVMPMTSRAIH